MIDERRAPPLASQPAGASAPAIAAAVLSVKLTALLTLVDRFDEARTAALAGLARVRPEDSLQAARLQFLLSELEFQDHRFDEPLAASDAAEELIGPAGLEDDQERVDVWLRARLRVAKVSPRAAAAPAARATSGRRRTTSMLGPLRLGSDEWRASWKLLGPMSVGIITPVPIEGWRAPLVPIPGMVAVPTMTRRVGGT